MTELVEWLRAALNSVESDARSFLELHPGWPDWPTLGLANVVASRRILDEHSESEGVCSRCGEEDMQEYYDGETETETAEYEWRQLPFPCLTVRLLAVPHADWPGYRDEWRP